MKLWILRPVRDWEPWYDKAFGFVVCAETEAAARALVTRSTEAGDEGDGVWSDPKETTCVELVAEEGERIVMRDFYAA